MLSVTQCGGSSLMSRYTPVSVVPVPSSVVSGWDAMSLTARESAFSIVFGVTAPAVTTPSRRSTVLALAISPPM